jgi:hypothetical protein
MLFARAHEVIERQARDPLLAILDDSGSRSVQGQTEKNSVRAYVFRFALELGHCSTQSACLKGAIIGLMHRSRIYYSITWSARSKKASEIVRPSAFAVFRLMISSNLVGRSTGSSPGRLPLRILSVNAAARR